MRVHSGKENPSQTGIICAMEVKSLTFLFLLALVRPQKQVLTLEFNLHKIL